MNKLKNCFYIFCMILTTISCKNEVSYKIVETYIPTEKERAVWDSLLDKGIEQLVFVKRYTYNSNHYYTEYLNSSWMPGGNLYILSLRDGTVKELVPELNGGVFGKFDISYDAQKVVFAYKASPEIGYRIYEVGIDGNHLKQLTFSPEDEADIVKKYALWGYHHGTEDLDPCYLPDGGIAFISTRCRYGTLCDGPDLFTSTVMYRMDGDGSHMKQLSYGSVSENTPCVLPDGRIMYTRWEYVDKGAVAVKCLWAMMPDGSGSSEIYGNDINFPTTMIMGRPIPGTINEYVFTGTPHFPQNCVGTIVRIDMNEDIRTKNPMTYITPDTDIKDEGGFHFRDSVSGEWIADGWGHGPLFRESYPLSRTEFIVSHKPAGFNFIDSAAYDIYLLHEGGSVNSIYQDDTISCFNPMPLIKRTVPPVISSKLNDSLARSNKAECIISDVYKGLSGIKRGEVKYIRVLEQVPRPWGARRFYGGDEYDQQHAVISKDTHLGLKVQHGIVQVESDGSARFLVPANKNIFFQVLDSNYMALQTERTFVNFMPGEIRSCIGCHETTRQTPHTDSRQTPLAMLKAAVVPQKQPGDSVARKTLSYAADVQPVWDKHCISCHSGTHPAGKLNLSGELTTLFNVSYENLVPERRRGYYDRGVLGPVIGENHPKTGNIHYLPPKSLGSHASILVAMLSDGKVVLQDSMARIRSQKLAVTHKKIKLTQEEMLKITNWVDTNCQYYGSYYGKRNLAYKDLEDFRTEYDYETAVSPEAPVPAIIAQK